MSASPAVDHVTSIDWRAVRDETVAHLRAVLRIDSTNPPGNEIAVARYLEGVCRDAGIESTILEPAPTRASFIARLRGRDEKPPMLLLAHMDVVAAQRERWSVDPFGGELGDGYVYGRGAIDDKGMLATNLVTLLLLERHVMDRGGTLSRDVIFVATADEEHGGEWGISWLIANHPELVRGEFALNEGGRIRIVDGRPLYAAVQNAEKSSHAVRVTARGPGGHASVPLRDNALFRLGRALAAIGAHEEPVRLAPTTRRFFEELSGVWPDARERRALRDLVSRDAARTRRGARVLSGIPAFDAVLRNTVSATGVAGGVRRNVIPTDASATLDIRTLPGQSVHSVLRRLRKAVNDPEVEITLEKEGPDAPPSDADSAMFAAIADAAREIEPTLAVVPYLSTGATDSAKLRAWGMQCYGLLPFPLAPDDERRMHAADERVPVASLEFAVRLTYGMAYRLTR